ncbi:MAG: hypothetical protein FWE17_02325 [Alphaproteobacteria bacterium]|nr:hypothetical protein [Alphaproteobacteria bacterium]MCL2758500.1 hypothetical protein [Alphaproteobacteria bacterium]
MNKKYGFIGAVAVFGIYIVANHIAHVMENRKVDEGSDDYTDEELKRLRAGKKNPLSYITALPRKVIGELNRRFDPLDFLKDEKTR